MTKKCNKCEGSYRNILGCPCYCDCEVGQKEKKRVAQLLKEITEKKNKRNSPHGQSGERIDVKFK